MGRRPTASPITPEPVDLVYVDDTTLAGIQRLRKGQGFAYRTPDGRWLGSSRADDKAHLARIRALAIPPAYVDVWICPLPHGHLQATGRDARGRKQYRYHPAWRQARELDKFGRMRAFGLALTALRDRVAKDLSSQLPQTSPRRQHVLATLVRLLDTTHVRIGNTTYAKENQSFGLTTLRNKHVKVDGDVVQLNFRGKSGVRHKVSVQDPRVAKIVRRCQNLPGQDLFEYEDEEGVVRQLGSADVNSYIREASGGDFTAKDFRTWHATVHAWALLAPQGQVSPGSDEVSNAARTRQLLDALKEVAAALGNTVAVCRKSYVHPMVLDCALCGTWPELEVDDQITQEEATPLTGLSDEERGLLRFLEKHPPQAAKPASGRRRV